MATRRPPACKARANFLDDRRLARSADGQVANADDETAERALPKDPLPIKKQAKLHDPLVNERKRVKNPAQDRGAKSAAPPENDVDGKLLEAFNPVTHFNLRF